jgi:nitrate reductase beta subunit
MSMKNYGNRTRFVERCLNQLRATCPAGTVYITESIADVINVHEDACRSELGFISSVREPEEVEEP